MECALCPPWTLDTWAPGRLPVTCFFRCFRNCEKLTMALSLLMPGRSFLDRCIILSQLPMPLNGRQPSSYLTSHQELSQGEADHVTGIWPCAETRTRITVLCSRMPHGATRQDGTRVVNLQLDPEPPQGSRDLRVTAALWEEIISGASRRPHSVSIRKSGAPMFKASFSKLAHSCFASWHLHWAVDSWFM